MILSGLVQQMGEDAAFAYLKQLHANVAIYAERGLEVPQALVQGKAAIGVGFLFGFETARQKGAPLAAIMPCEGSSHEVGGIALVRGRPHGESGQRYYDWLLGPAGQASASRADSLQVPANASYRRDERIPGYAEAPMRPYDFARYGQNSERQRLLGHSTGKNERCRQSTGKVPAAAYVLRAAEFDLHFPAKEMVSGTPSQKRFEKIAAMRRKPDTAPCPRKSRTFRRA